MYFNRPTEQNKQINKDESTLTLEEEEKIRARSAVIEQVFECIEILVEMERNNVSGIRIKYNQSEWCIIWNKAFWLADDI